MLGFLSKVFKSPEPPDKNGFDQYMVGNKGRPNILIFTENVNATYFISFEIPLATLHRQGLVNFAVASQLRVGKKGSGIWERWDRGLRPDLVVLTRYGLPFGKEILDYFRVKNIPVVYHIDDNLLEIPSSLGAVIQQSQGAVEVIQERRYLLENCDLIYASTTYLTEHLKSLFPQQRFFTGIYAPYMASHIHKKKKLFKAPLTIGYMGSRGHQEDLELVVPALVRLLDDNPKLRFEVFGTIKMPPALVRFGARVKSHAVNKGYVGFLEKLANLDWDVGLAPLVDDKFNLCKAPTKYIEYTAAGVPVVASDIPVYSEVIPKDGGLLVQQDWYAALDSLLKSPKLRETVLENAQTFCATAFAETTLQRQLQDLISEAKRPAIQG
jgi:glycosyltransferase involved in cell wall biosynthesis